MESNYELLRKKEIIEILDGDTTIEEVNGIRIAMPYLSGPQLCDLSQEFGCFQEYYWGNSKKVNLSRWQYLDNLLKYAITENKVSQLLSYMMDKERFLHVLRPLRTVEEIENQYQYIIKSIISKINSILYFGGHELDVISNQYIIKKIGTKVEIETPNLKFINTDYIKDLSARAIKNIEDNDFDSAITKSRTILEETFCYVIEQKGEKPSDSGDISKLYKQVKDLYNMHADKDMDVRINKLLSGLEKIVSGLAEMRNNGSDSHGLGSKRIGILPYHARLAVNSAVTMSEFILSVSQNSKDNA